MMDCIKYLFRRVKRIRECEAFWDESHEDTVEALRVSFVLMLMIILIACIDDLLRAHEYLHLSIPAKLLALTFLSVLLYLSYRPWGQRQIMWIAFFGFTAMALNVLFQAYILDTIALIAFLAGFVSVFAAMSISCRLRHYFLLTFELFIAMLVGDYWIEGPPLLPLAMETGTGIILILCSIFLAYYSNLRRFELWETRTILQEERERFRQFADHSRDIIWIWSPDRTIEYISPAYERFTGRTREKLYKDSSLVLHMVHHDDRAEFSAAIEDIIRGEYRKVDLRVEHVGGTPGYLEVWGAPVRNEKGQVVRCIGIWRDITERKQIEAQKQYLAALEERERIGRELHDDLGQVMGFVNVQAQAALARLQQRDIEQSQAILHQVVQVAQDAQNDVRGYILNIRTGATSPPENFFAALERYLDTLCQRYGLDVQVSWPDELLESPLATESETQLLRIIQEALSNVRKHAGVSLAQVLFTLHADELQTIIEDDGRGFTLVSEGPSPGTALPGTSDLAAQTLDPGPRADGHFGLDIMRERAEIVGGSLEVRSAPGAGTRVIVRLPRHLAPTVDGKFEPGLRVLLVDDHPLYLGGLKSLLAARGIHVVGEAHDGLEAQAQARMLRPDLILMDVQMPHCDGVEATQRIKAELPEVKIVMLTMAADDDTLFDALKSGASGYLLKTLDGSQFFSLLSQVMAGETVLSPSLASRVLAEFARQSDAPDEKDDPVLTSRQMEVLKLVAQGLSNKEIAAALYISESTVKFHVSQILERLQLKSRHQLARYVDQQELPLP